MRSHRWVLVAAACVLQLLLVGIAVAPRLSARVLGEEYRVAVAPIDPIDPFRGAYVALTYPGITQPEEPVGFPERVEPAERPRGPQQERPDEPAVEPAEEPVVEPFAESLEGEVFVPLVRDGDVWTGGEPTAQRPAAPPYLACSADGVPLDCGIGSLFASQEEARRLEQVLAGNAVATLRVDARGNAAVVSVGPR